jgi:uncharacterized membrane protein
LDTNFLAEIHPKVVHFPIALLTTYSLLEIFGVIFKNEFISKTALLILCLGVLSAFFSVFTGNQAANFFSFWNEESRNLLNEHESFATYLLWSSAIICALRIFVTVKKKFRTVIKLLFVVAAFLLLYLVYETGIRGGDLVKKYGVGLNLESDAEIK